MYKKCTGLSLRHQGNMQGVISERGPEKKHHAEGIRLFSA
jgi:hypothetical protein